MRDSSVFVPDFQQFVFSVHSSALIGHLFVLIAQLPIINPPTYNCNSSPMMNQQWPRQLLSIHSKAPSSTCTISTKHTVQSWFVNILRYNIKRMAIGHNFEALGTTNAPSKTMVQWDYGFTQWWGECWRGYDSGRRRERVDRVLGRLGRGRRERRWLDSGE